MECCGITGCRRILRRIWNQGGFPAPDLRLPTFANAKRRPDVKRRAARARATFCLNPLLPLRNQLTARRLILLSASEVSFLSVAFSSSKVFCRTLAQSLRPSCFAHAGCAVVPAGGEIAAEEHRNNGRDQRLPEQDPKSGKVSPVGPVKASSRPDSRLDSSAPGSIWSMGCRIYPGPRLALSRTAQRNVFALWVFAVELSAATSQ